MSDPLMAGKWKNKRVAVLMGGVSKEREISLKSGTAITKALKSCGYGVIEIDVGEGFDLVDRLRSEKPDVVLIALHGKFGEDGCVQGLLEMLRIPYTGGGVMASSVAMDKVLCNRVARELGIKCPGGILYDAEDESPRDFVSRCDIELPVIIKPSREGSTINMTIVKNQGDLIPALERAMGSDNKILVERYIEGREVTVGILNGKAVSPLEIVPKSGFYDFKSKYTKGMTEYIVPARISAKCAEKLKSWSELICGVIECDGTARTDFIVAPDEEAFFLEINTIPGMTELSLVPKAAAYDGLSFEDVCERLLDGAALKVNI